MNERVYKLGERVYAAVGGTGAVRLGTITATTDTPGFAVPPYDERQYMVLFDGHDGHSGPCVVYRAEGECEAVSPTIGTAA